MCHKGGMDGLTVSHALLRQHLPIQVGVERDHLLNAELIERPLAAGFAQAMPQLRIAQQDVRVSGKGGPAALGVQRVGGHEEARLLMHNQVAGAGDRRWPLDLGP